MTPEAFKEFWDIDTGFYGGTLPDWMTTDSFNGSVTIDGGGTEGGRAQLKSGTTSTGDLCRLEAGSIDADGPDSGDNHDVWRLRALVKTSTNDSTLASAYFRFIASSSDQLRYDIIANELKLADGSTKNIAPFDASKSVHEVELIWFYGRGEMLLNVDGFEVTRDDRAPTASGVYYPRLEIETNDISNNRIMNVYYVEVSHMWDRLATQ